jgi:Domain of unknown function (DUF4411)
MAENPPYLLDSDVFISAKNAYYAFDICPGFWKSIIHFQNEKRVASIDKVRSELLAGRKDDDLVIWVHKSLTREFFLTTDSGDISSNYRDVMLWVQRSPQYLDAAKAKFATEADGWLVAYAMVHGSVVITHEQPRPQSKSKVFLPDVCNQFKVKYDNAFVMLRELGAQFQWKSPEDLGRLT